MQVTEYTYGQVGEVRVGRGKMQVLRVWVKRPAGWRILHYHEVALAEHAGASALSANDCNVPCKMCRTREGRRGEGDPRFLGGVGVGAHRPRRESMDSPFSRRVHDGHFGRYQPDHQGGSHRHNQQARFRSVTLCRPRWVAGETVRVAIGGGAAGEVLSLRGFGRNHLADQTVHRQAELSTRIWHVDREGIWQMMESWDTEIQSEPAAVPKP